MSWLAISNRYPVQLEVLMVTNYLRCAVDSPVLVGPIESRKPTLSYIYPG